MLLIKKKKVRGASMFFDSNDPTYKQKYFYHTFNRFLRFLFFFSVDLGKVFWRGEKKNQNKTSLDFCRNCLHRRQSFPKYHNC